MQGQSSARSLESGVSSNASVSRSLLQKEAIDYDRRQIRRKLADTLRDRGVDPEEELKEDYEDGDDDESVYDDTEVFPWKQREAAVQAAAAGGKTEGRMEGFDSLERALQAHTHQIHYGRGKSFGWSAQHRSSSSSLLQTQHKLQSMRQTTDWTSFRDLNQAAKDNGGDFEEDFQDEIQATTDAKARKKKFRSNTLLSTLYILIAIGATMGFAYYVETIKIDTYQTFLPKGYTNMGAVDVNSEQEPDDSQAAFVEAARLAANVARAP